MSTPDEKKSELVNAIGERVKVELATQLSDILLRLKDLAVKVDALSASGSTKSKKATKTTDSSTPAANGVAATESKGEDKLPSNALNYFKDQYVKKSPEATKFWDQKYDAVLKADTNKYKTYKNKKDGEDKEKARADYLWLNVVGEDVKNAWAAKLKGLKDKTKPSTQLSADKSG